MERVIVWQVGRRRLEVHHLEAGARAAVLLDGETFAGCWPLPPRPPEASTPPRSRRARAHGSSPRAHALCLTPGPACPPSSPAPASRPTTTRARPGEAFCSKPRRTCTRALRRRRARTEGTR